MLKSIKSKFNRSKKFVENHSTLTACAVTAVASTYVTRKVDIREMRNFAYEAGRRAGELEAYLLAAYDFIEDKGLSGEFENNSK